jgi:hypothetical protein
VRLLGFLQELPDKCQHAFGLHRLEGRPKLRSPHASAVPSAWSGAT